MDFTLTAVVVMALFFDFTNGFHDTANAIATVISTKAVSPKVAVIGAAIFNFLGAFVSLKVAATIAKGVVSPKAITIHVILAGLLGAIIWNLITWRQGLPSSSSHALIGGIAGSAVMALGFHVIRWDGLRDKVLLPSLISPFLGLLGAGLLTLGIICIVRNHSKQGAGRVFRRLQLISGSFLAFTHGTNDAQKTMGVIALALLVGHPEKAFHVPLWVIASSALAMALGTAVGGWRIIDTLGQKITKLEPQQGFAAEASTSTTLLVAAHFGFPVSTTHTMSGSILGAGAATRPSVVNWKVVRHIIVAWLITIPCAGAVSAVMEIILRSTHSVGVVLTVALVVVATIYATRNWTWESTAQVRSRLSVLRQVRIKL
nr:Phosphate transporter family [uncultured bacterium]